MSESTICLYLVESQTNLLSFDYERRSKNSISNLLFALALSPAEMILFEKL